jgi:hypothetical protein
MTFGLFIWQNLLQTIVQNDRAIVSFNLRQSQICFKKSDKTFEA